VPVDPTGTNGTQPDMIQIEGNIERSFTTARPGGIHLRLDPECGDVSGCKWNKG